MTEPIIRIEQLRKRLGGVPVIDGLDLEVYQGEILTLIGKSGVGKSILLKLMINILDPDGGRIFFEGKPLATLKRAERSELRRKMSYVFQGTALLDSMTVYENIALPLREKRRGPAAEIRRRVSEKMAQLDLADAGEKYPAQLSGGMRKRVALARALVTDPVIVLFDEPTTGLDPIRKHAVHSLITDYQKRFGFTAVLVSHEIPDVFYISQRIAMLDEGRIVFAGTPEELRRSANPVVRGFVGGLAPRVDRETAMTDPAELDRCLSRELARAETDRTPLSVVVLTLENLGEINSRFGFMAGQHTMRHLLEQVQRRLKPADTSARVGLDKVLVLLSGATREEARACCASMAEGLGGTEVLDRAVPADFCLSLSAGFAEADQANNIEVVLAAAEASRNPLESFTICQKTEAR
jgi:phospholipid/cholesterol/gamma-HCH transport system ATP-binding protein